MITQVQTGVNTLFTASTSQPLTLGSVATIGNLVVITGTFPFASPSVYPVITVTDSAGSIYSAFSDNSTHFSHGIALWSAYALIAFTGTLTITVTYSTAITNVTIGATEFSSDALWVTPVAADGDNFATANTGSAITVSLTTTNFDDLVIMSYYHGATSVLFVEAGWTPFLQLTSNVNCIWTEASPAGPSTPIATQSASAPWACAIWAFKSQATASKPIISLVTAYVSPTAFVEVYPNRIPEDIYDSLSSQPEFVFVQYGPSLLN